MRPILLIVMALMALWPLNVAAEPMPEQMKGVDVVEHLGENIPLDLQFVDHNGKSVTLADYFNKGKPVVLNLVYYNCPMLCTMVLNGFIEGLSQLTLEPGRDFDVVTVSIDPTETPELSKAKRAAYLEQLNRHGANSSWHFLTGEEKNIKALAQAIGFQYQYDERQEEYAHPAVIFILTETGKLARYLYGIKFKPMDLRLSLLEASEGKVGTTIDRLILYCYYYDSDANSYALFARNLMKLGGILTILIVASILFPVWFRSWRKPKSSMMAVEGTHE